MSTHHNTEWRKGPLNWSRRYLGHALTVKSYVGFKGRKLVRVYVPRIDTSAPTSPAMAYASLSKAKRVAEDFAASIGKRGNRPPVGDHPMVKKSQSDRRFEAAFRDLPDCVQFDPLRHNTVNDLWWACRIQLDLIEEDQDGTEDDDPAAIRRWIRKYGKPE